MKTEETPENCLLEEAGNTESSCPVRSPGVKGRSANPAGRPQLGATPLNAGTPGCGAALRVLGTRCTLDTTLVLHPWYYPRYTPPLVPVPNVAAVPYRVHPKHARLTVSVQS